jgi:hypothetical protein
LLVLIRAVLIVKSGFITVETQTGTYKTLLFIHNLGAIIFLTVTVAVLAYLNILEGTKGKVIRDYSIFIEPPNDLPGLDINRIVWDDAKCIMKVHGREIAVVPTSPHGASGAALEIRIPSDDFPSDEHAPIQLSLTDQYGNRWDVISFRLWQKNLRLRIRSDRKKIIEDYPDESGQ